MGSKYFIAVIISIFFLTAGCVNNPRDQKYIEQLERQYSSIKLVGTERTDQFVEITFIHNDSTYEAGFNKNGDWLYTEHEIKLPSTIHEKITKILQNQYSDWIIDEYSYVQRKDSAFYKVELINDGLEENVYFRLDGELYQAKVIDHGKKWSAKNFLPKENEQATNLYDFLHPSETWEMPDELVELSGICPAGDSKFYGIEDEDGTVYTYNIRTKRVTDKQKFKKHGDFEDIATDNKNIYVLRSDGRIYWFPIQHPHDEEHADLSVKADNIEGLFYNPNNRKLYIACKSPTENEDKSIRQILSFTLYSTHNPTVELNIDTKRIIKKIKRKYPELASKKLRFNPSGMAIHPNNKEWYILSARDRIIAVYNQKKLKDVFVLPSSIYYQPEGITFLPNGDMYIASEGDKKHDGKGKLFYLPEKNNRK